LNWSFYGPYYCNFNLVIAAAHGGKCLYDRTFRHGANLVAYRDNDSYRILGLRGYFYCC